MGEDGADKGRLIRSEARFDANRSSSEDFSVGYLEVKREIAIKKSGEKAVDRVEDAMVEFFESEPYQELSGVVGMIDVMEHDEGLGGFAIGVYAEKRARAELSRDGKEPDNTSIPMRIIEIDRELTNLMEKPNEQ